MYKIEFKRQYKVTGRYTANMLGTLVIFKDGIGYTNREDIAEHARNLRFIESVEDMTQKAASKEVVQEDISAPSVTEEHLDALEDGNHTPEGETDEPVGGDDEEDFEGETVDVVIIDEHDEVVVDETVFDETIESEVVEEVAAEDEVEDKDPEASEEPNIPQLYEELGTWKAVADHLGVTTAVLRKMREEQGL